MLALQQEERLKVLEDDDLLELAAGEDRVLITRNSKDFTPILVDWARGGRVHAGCILIWSLDHAEYGRILREVERLLSCYPRPDGWAGIARSV